MKKKSLSLNAFLSGIRSISNLIFPLVTFPYVSRVLDVDGIGKYNFSSSVVSYFLLIAALGISPYAVREGAKYRDDKEKISQFSSEIFSINIFSTLLAYMLLVLSLIFFSKLHNYIFCILIFSIQIIFTTLGTEWIYTIYEDFAYITIRSIIFQIFSLILLFIFVRHPDDYLNYASITVFSAVGSNILNFIHAKKFCKIRLTLKANFSTHLVPILILFFAGIANMIYVNSDITILGIMKSNYIVGIYSISSKIYNMGKVLLSAVLLVSIPRLALLFGKERINQYKDLLKKVINVLMLMILPCMTGLFILAPAVIKIIAGVRYIRATNSLRILCLAYIFSIVAWILTDCVLVPARREKDVLLSSSVSAVLNLILNIILVPIWAENAAAFSTIIAEFTMMAINFWCARDLIKDVFLSENVIKNFINGIIGCLGIILICLLINSEIHLYLLSFMISVVLSVIIYLSTLIIIKNQMVINFIKGLSIKFLKNRK